MFKILYIEDTENNRILITRRLGQSGYRVLTAENAEQGMKVARAEHPDLILMDMGLPDVDGWNATGRFKADPELKLIPVIALTAHVMHGDREKALAAGCDDYDTKPFQFTRLLSKIETLLANPGNRSPRMHEAPASVPHPLSDLIAQTRHDLCNPLGNILGFCEILLQPDQPPRDLESQKALKSISDSATRMVKALKQVLTSAAVPSGHDAIKALQVKLRQRASDILHTNQALIEKAAGSQDTRFREDLGRMLDSTQRVDKLVNSALSHLLDASSQR